MPTSGSFRGNLEITKSIKEDCSQFLLDNLELKLSPSKTLITDVSQEQAKFLGFTPYTFLEIHVLLEIQLLAVVSRVARSFIGMDTKRLESRFILRKYMEPKTLHPQRGLMVISL